MKTIDARGEKCPTPVIWAKNALKEAEGVVMLVDNVIACENLEKMAKVLGYGTKRSTQSENDFSVAISKGEISENTAGSEEVKINCDVYETRDSVCVISSSLMGSGDDQLGEMLMKAFVFALSEQDAPPQTILFYNGGVKLTTESSPVLEELQKLKDLGVTIKSCGACLNHYGLTEKLRVGEVTNMYDIVSVMMKGNVFKP